MAIITISRGTFSGGAEIATCLADRLECECVSREVLVDAGESYGVSAEVLATALGKAPGFFERIGKDRDRYLAYIRAALTKRALAGRLVYHGNAGHFLLAGIKHVIRARVVAPMGFRIDAAMRRLGLTHQQAITHIEKVDKERRRWTHFLYHVDWEAPEHYDLVLNLENMDPAGACDTIASMVELPSFQPTEESRRDLANLVLKSAVVAALASDPHAADAELQVSAAEGVVTVTGWARTESTVELVPKLVSSVEGVTEVKSELSLGRGI